MVLRPICEPVELPIGASVIAEKVVVSADAPEIGPFRHFHDVAELVLFQRVAGDFIVEGRRHRLQGGSIVFVPSMRHHDYALERGPMEWLLIQIDPYIVESLAFKTNLRVLGRPFCASLDDCVRMRVEMLGRWLVDAVAGSESDAKVQRLVELLLLAVADAPDDQVNHAGESSVHAERFLPALQRLRTAPAEPLPLEAAASLCSLSPTYFSRRFCQLFGMSFSNYARIYRLHLAARRLVGSGASISEIGFGVGFASPAHFSARFRERFGMTPRAYRASAGAHRPQGRKIYE